MIARLYQDIKIVIVHFFGLVFGVIVHDFGSVFLSTICTSTSSFNFSLNIRINYSSSVKGSPSSNPPLLR